MMAKTKTAKPKYGDVIELVKVGEPMPGLVWHAEQASRRYVWAGTAWYSERGSYNHVLQALLAEPATGEAAFGLRAVPAGNCRTYGHCERLTSSLYGFCDGKLILKLSPGPVYSTVKIEDAQASRGFTEIYFAGTSLGASVARATGNALPPTLREGVVVLNRTDLHLKRCVDLYATATDLYVRLSRRDLGAGDSGGGGWKALRKYDGARRLVHRVRHVPGGQELLDLVADAALTVDTIGDRR